MKVTFTWTNDAGTTQKLVLGDDSLGRGPGSALVVSSVPDWAQAVQVQEFLRADTSTPLSRGNARRPYALTVAREFSTLDEASAWMFDHPGEFPPRKTGTIELKTSAAGGSRMRYLSSASLQELRFAQLGATVQATYTFIAQEST